MFKSLFRGAVLSTALAGNGALAEGSLPPPVQFQCSSNEVLVRFNNCAIRMATVGIISNEGMGVVVMPQMVCDPKIYNQTQFEQVSSFFLKRHPESSDFIEGIQEHFDRPETTCPQLAMF